LIVISNAHVKLESLKICFEVIHTFSKYKRNNNVRKVDIETFHLAETTLQYFGICSCNLHFER